MALDALRRRVMARATLPDATNHAISDRLKTSTFALAPTPVSSLGAGDVAMTRGLRLLGRSDEVTDEIHAICSRRGRHHPLVTRILEAARG